MTRMAAERLGSSGGRCMRMTRKAESQEYLGRWSSEVDSLAVNSHLFIPSRPASSHTSTFLHRSNAASCSSPAERRLRLRARSRHAGSGGGISKAPHPAGVCRRGLQLHPSSCATTALGRCYQEGGRRVRKTVLLRGA
jgi:hypothetical protein